MSHFSSAYSSPRGRSLRGRGGVAATTKASVELPKTFDLGAAISSLDRTSLRASRPAPKITNVEDIASYNWLDTAKPTILVPGSPPAWTPPASVTTLRWDRGEYFRDKNAARYPSFPVEPAIRAVLELQPEFSFKGIDIVACSSTLNKLLCFARGERLGFRFHVDVVGRTLFFLRDDGEPRALIPDVRGYGHTFNESYTTWDAAVANSCSHQRIVRYQLGGLTMMVRFECDGYRRAAFPAPQSSKPRDAEKADMTEDELIRDLLDSLGVSSSKLAPEDEQLTIRREGSAVPRSSIFDIKTRSVKAVLETSMFVPRLWTSQTPNFVLALHNRGTFNDPVIKEYASQIRQWEETYAEEIALYYAILKEIISLALDPANGGKLVVSWDGVASELKVTKPLKPKSALPKDLVEELRI